MSDSSTFFLSWQLWEQLSGALAFALVIAVFSGTCRLVYKRWWVSRAARKEEARLRDVATACRENKISVVKGSDGVLFGLPALRYGTQIPGIWNATDNIPALDVTGRLRKSASSTTESIGSKNSSTISFAKNEKTPMGDDRGNLPSMTFSYDHASDIENGNVPHFSLPPRMREVTREDLKLDEETLGQFEGQSAANMDLGRSLGKSGFQLGPPSVVADSDHASTSNSSVFAEPEGEVVEYAAARSNQNAQEDLPPRVGEYFSVAQDAPEMHPLPHAQSSAKLSFVSSHQSLNALAAITESTESNEPLLAEEPLLREEKPGSPAFGAGTVHANRYVRKVNSSFQLFPAGTLEGRPSMEQEALNEMQSNEAKKKNRLSIKTYFPRRK